MSKPQKKKAMTRVENVLNQCRTAAADVALWPKWKSGHSTPKEVPSIDILMAAGRRINELISALEVRYKAFPFLELALVIHDLKVVLDKINTNYAKTCGKSPLEQLAGAADEENSVPEID